MDIKWVIKDGMVTVYLNGVKVACVSEEVILGEWVDNNENEWIDKDGEPIKII